jgi:imidazolonepropionase-like amidohydrolase
MADGGIVAFRAARVFDGTALHEEFPLVVIDRSRLVAIDRTSARPPADFDVRDLGDVTVLPGLIDAHVHLAFDADRVTKHQEFVDEDDETILTRMRRHAARQLAVGVTTVRDLGDRNYLALALRDQYRSDPTAGPDVVASGPPITRTGGHCCFLGGEADGTAAVQAAVRERVRRGVDVIQVMATGGATTTGWALASATTVAAQACGIGDRKGRIAPGYDADLVAVAGNPLHNLEALMDVRAVVRMGRLVRLNGSPDGAPRRA